LPVRGSPLARRIDRRLGLDAALVTSLQVRESSDPICRLLLARMETALRPIPMRTAVPLRPPAAALVVPALVVLAAGLSLRAPSAVQGPGEGGGPIGHDAQGLSDQIQATASRIVLSDAAAPQEVSEVARRLLEIDEALRRGALGAREAGAALARLRDELSAHAPGGERARQASREAGNGGSDGARGAGSSQTELASPSGDWRSALAMLVEIPRSSVSGAGAALDRSAGRGRAELDAGETAASLRAEERSRASGAWWLPPPSGPTGADGGSAGDPAASIDPSPVGSGRIAGPRRDGPAFLMTPAERDLVQRYFESLRRREGGVHGPTEARGAY
jgi:hypothetical protein